LEDEKPGFSEKPGFFPRTIEMIPFTHFSNALTTPPRDGGWELWCLSDALFRRCNALPPDINGPRGLPKLLKELLNAFADQQVRCTSF
jgi:hypothetical protein